MVSVRLIILRSLAFLSLALTTLSCEGDNGPETAVLSTVVVSLSPSTIVVGQTATATASGLDQNDVAIDLSAVIWSSSSAAATVDADGVVTGAAPGTALILATVDGKTGQQAITVTAVPAIVINEVESNGGTPGDWVELYNPTTTPVDLSGWVFKDNDDAHVYTLPAGSTIPAGGYLVLEEADINFGLGAPDEARIFTPFGTLVDSYGWSTHAGTTYGRCPTGSGAFITTTNSTKGMANDCAAPLAEIKINEVESNNGTPGDWIELYNAGSTAASLAGYIIKDNDDAHSYVIPVGTTVAAGGYLVVEEAALGFGLGGADAVRVFTSGNVLVDSYTWEEHATVTYGRCPNGTGDFTTTTSATKGAANACPGEPVTFSWPGSNSVQAVDGAGVFTSNLSGLIYQGASGADPAVLWAVLNGPGTLFRLVWNGTIWTPDPANEWGAGKALRYPNSLGNPDAEGVTFAATVAGGMYVATERNNDASTVSRNSILRFDPAASGTSLTATHEWNLTSDIPTVGANLGLEAITWIPDAFLVGRGFYDESAGHPYNPAEYPDHGDGLFFVGVEGNGMIYGYALNHTTNGFTRVATFSSGFAGVMELEFDRELNYLWATCDDGCGNMSSILEIDTQVGIATSGRFVVSRRFERPSTLPNVNNEGFAIAPQSECVGGQKPAFWSDDNGTSGHALRRDTVPCTSFP